jgi:N-carbamoylputrescine amidase
MTQRKPIVLGLIQMRCSAIPAENLDRAKAFLHEAAAKGATVACLPELFLSHYFCQTEDPDVFDLAEAIPGPTTAALGEVAKATGMVIVGSLFERRAAGVYHNTAVVLESDN